MSEMRRGGSPTLRNPPTTQSRVWESRKNNSNARGTLAFSPGGDKTTGSKDQR